MIFNPHLTISLRYQEKVGSFLTLADNDVFWKIKQSCDIINQKVYNVLVVTEDGVAFD